MHQKDKVIDYQLSKKKDLEESLNQIIKTTKEMYEKEKKENQQKEEQLEKLTQKYKVLATKCYNQQI